MTGLERKLERELVALLQSIGRGCVFDVAGDPHFDVVRAHEPENEDRTIHKDSVTSVSLTTVARLLARVVDEARADTVREFTD
jgi:hypothetical protein